MTLLRALDLVGVAVFAVSGAIAAGRRGLDLLGVLVLGLVTAIGGGTIRDVLLDRHPIFWLADPAYLYTIAGAVLVTVAYTRWRPPPEAALGVADALGLALFSVAGAQIAERAGLPAAAGVVLGTVTGSAGGAVRDILCAEVPMVLRRGSLYASAAIVGTSLYFVLERAGVERETATYVGMTAVAALRLAAISWRLQLPVFRLEAHDSTTMPGARTASIRVEHTGEYGAPGAVRARAATSSGGSSGASSGASSGYNFSADVRRALTAAREAAARRGEEVTPDLMLAASLGIPGSAAAQLLGALGVDPSAITGTIERSLSQEPAPGPARARDDTTYSPAARRTLASAMQEAFLARAAGVDTGHLLLAVLRDGGGAGAAALAAAGITLDAARAARVRVPPEAR